MAQLIRPAIVMGGYRRLVTIAVVAWTTVQPASGQTLTGPEFQVNTYTTSAQREPAVSAAASGAFVVVWWSFGQDGASSGIFGQRYDAVGTPQGAEFRVNTYTPSAQSDPAIATDASGRFIVTWSGAGPGASGANSIWARRYASSGAALGPEFEVTSYAPTSGFTRNTRIAALTNLGFVVTWQADGDGDGDGIFARRYNSAGVAQGPQFQVNTYTTGGQTVPAVAGGRDGGFVVVWQSVGQDGSLNAVVGKRYNSAGAAQGTEFQVNAYVTGNQSRPWITSVPNDGFVVVWDGLGAGNTLDVFGRRLSVSGTPYGPRPGSTPTPPPSRTDRGSWLAPMAAFSSSGTRTVKTERTRVSSRSSSTGPARRWRESFRSAPTRRGSSSTRRWPPGKAGRASWSG